MGKRGQAWLSAADAAGLLGVNRATLYAYVSRGQVRSEPVPGSARQRRYARDDIERMLSRQAQRRNPESAAAETLHWGLPVLESAITLIADDRMYYRGCDAAELAASCTIAEVASLIWTGSLAESLMAQDREAFELPPFAPGLAFVARAQTALAAAAAQDPFAYDLRPGAVARTGWRILNLCADVAARSQAHSRHRAPSDERAGNIDDRLAAAWGVPEARDLLRTTLILCADHELNVSAFTARCVASAGTNAYGVVIAALAALDGFRHGGATSRIEALWSAIESSSDITQSLVKRLGRGEPVDGFGHPLYPAGDPRARLLLERLPMNEQSETARRFAAAAAAVLGEQPVLDFALVALRRTLGLPEGAALTLFAVGRTIGWLGHAIEQYALHSLIRPRAKYVGELPG
jgi:citrate synthase